MNEVLDRAVPSRTIVEIVPDKVYSTCITPSAVEVVLFISTYDTQDPKSPAINQHGYQRPPTATRFPEIAQYYRTANNSDRIPPLLISVRLSEPDEIAEFLELLEAGSFERIHEQFGSDVMSVIDGQHRMRGLTYAWRQDPAFSPPIPLILYFGLSFSEEAELFNTINATQRKLPKALIETTRGDITEVSDLGYSQLIRRVAFSLCRDPDSPWGPIDGQEQINMTGVRDPNRSVTYEGLRRSTSHMFPSTLLERLRNIDPNLPTSLAKRYWKAVSEACTEAWSGEPSEMEVIDPETGDAVVVPIKYRLKDLVGVAALSKLGANIIQSQIDGNQANRLEQLAAKLADVNWAKDAANPWMRSQAGFAGQKDLYEMLYRLVYMDERPDDR